MTTTIDEGLVGPELTPDGDSAPAGPGGVPAASHRPGVRGRAMTVWGHLTESARTMTGWARGVTTPLWLRSMTGLGATVAACAAVMWLLGVLLGWQEFLVIAAVCLVALALSLPFLFGRLASDAQVEVEPRRVLAGGRVMGRVLVRNTSERRVLPMSVEVPVGAGLARFSVPSLAAGAEHEELFSVPTRRRAIIPIGPIHSTRGDALGLYRRVVRWGEPITLYVHPHTVVLPPIGTGLLRDLEGHTTDHLSSSDIAFHTLREYTPGDDRRHVHWRSSARAGKLLVRQFVDTRRTHVAVYLDEASSAYGARATPAGSLTATYENLPGVSEFECAVSVAASIGRRVLADDQDLSLMTDTEVAVGGPAVKVLDTLSGAELHEGGGTPSSSGQWISTRLARHTPDASIVVLVTGPARDISELRRATLSVPRSTRLVVVRAGGAGRTALREVSGMTVIDLAGLEDLAAILMVGTR